MYHDSSPKILENGNLSKLMLELKYGGDRIKKKQLGLVIYLSNNT